MPSWSGWVFDSWAMMAFLQAEPALPRIRSLMRQARRQGDKLWITTMNLGEVWYSLAGRQGGREADQALREVTRLGFLVEAVDWDLARRAAELKAKYRVGYADCIAAALAHRLGVELVTGDPDFRRLEKEIRICWV